MGCQASGLMSSRLSKSWRMSAPTVVRSLHKIFFLIFFFALEWQCNSWNWKRRIIRFSERFLWLDLCRRQLLRCLLYLISFFDNSVDDSAFKGVDLCLYLLYSLYKISKFSKHLYVLSDSKYLHIFGRI